MSLNSLRDLIENPHHVALGALVLAGVGLISAKKPHPLLQ